MPKPTPEHFSLIAEAAVRGLPDGFRRRHETLSALIAVLPDGEQRDEIVLMREHLTSHEAAQLKFIQISGGTAV